MSVIEQKAGAHWNQLRAQVVSKFGAVPAQPYELSMYLSSVLPLTNESKQLLLECRSTHARLEMLREVITMLDENRGRCILQ